MYKSYIFVVLTLCLPLPAVCQAQSNTYEAFLAGKAVLTGSAEDLTPEKWREFETGIRNKFYTAQWQELAQSVLNDNIDYWYMYYLLGKAAIGLGRLQEGVTYYQTTIDRGEHQKCINSDKNICREWIQSVREAIPEYAEALQLDNNEQQKFILLKNVKHVRLYTCTLWAIGSETLAVQAIPTSYKEVRFPIRRRYVSREELIDDCMKDNGMERVGREWEFTNAEIEKILVPESRLVMTKTVRDRQCEITLELSNRHYDLINPELELTFFDRDKNSLGVIDLTFPAIFSNKQHTEVVRDLGDYCEVIDSAYITEAADKRSGRALEGINDQFFNVVQAE